MALETKIIKKKDYVYLVELKGALDTDTHTQLEDELKEIIDEKTRVVIVDMAGVDYISSAGIAVVIWLKKELRNKNAEFSMVNVQPQIEKIFDMMKVLPMVNIMEDMEEADKYIDQIIKDELEKEKTA